MDLFKVEKLIYKTIKIQNNSNIVSWFYNIIIYLHSCTSGGSPVTFFQSLRSDNHKLYF